MSTFTFPSPIGGVSFHDDLAPSVLFAVLFGLLAPVFAFRFSRTSSRTFVIFGAFPYVVER